MKREQLVPEETIKEVIRAQKSFQLKIKNKDISYDMVLKIIKKTQRDLCYARRYYGYDLKAIRVMEMTIALLKSFHEENLKKYESYGGGDKNPNVGRRRLFPMTGWRDW